MSIDMKKVKMLRDNSRAGLSDCKAALEASDWDLDKARDYLKRAGCSVSNKKLSAETGEGLMSSRFENGFVYVLELNCQTDFVARNERFSAIISTLLDVAVKNNSKTLEELHSQLCDDGLSVEEYIKTEISVLGENIRIGNFECIDVRNNIASIYTHSLVVNGFGKIAALVILSTNIKDKNEALYAFAKDLAMHVVAFKPEFLSSDLVPADVIQKEKDISKEQFADSKKPQNIIEKIAQGRVEKYFSDVVLLDQFFVMDDKKKISTVLEEKRKELGGSIEIVSYKLFSLKESN